MLISLDLEDLHRTVDEENVETKTSRIHQDEEFLLISTWNLQLGLRKLLDYKNFIYWLLVKNLDFWLFFLTLFLTLYEIHPFFLEIATSKPISED